jgi:hypothetical protein
VAWDCSHSVLATTRPIVPAVDNGWRWAYRRRWNAWQGKQTYSKKTFPSAALSTTNSTYPEQGSNPGSSGVKQATNRLSCIKVSVQILTIVPDLEVTSWPHVTGKQLSTHDVYLHLRSLRWLRVWGASWWLLLLLLLITEVLGHLYNAG